MHNQTLLIIAIVAVVVYFLFFRKSAENYAAVGSVTAKMDVNSNCRQRMASYYHASDILKNANLAQTRWTNVVADCGINSPLKQKTPLQADVKKWATQIEAGNAVNYKRFWCDLINPITKVKNCI